MRILVTGGAGYIGSHTVRQLLAGGHEVTVLDSLCHGHREAVPADRLVVGDLRDAAFVDGLLSGRGVEAVVHFAAFTSVGESVADPAAYYANNLLCSLQLLNCCRRNGVRRFVFSSTEFGRPYVFPPDVPKERVDAVRKAIADAAHDPELLAEAARIKLDMTYHAPEQLERLVANLYATPPELIESIKKLVPAER